jgi:hypothetical protein
LTQAAAARGAPLRRRVLAALLLAAAFGWAALVHYGFGPRPDLGLSWWSPRGFLTRALLGSPWEVLALERSLGTLCFGAPALVLAAACWMATRSAVMRALAVSAALVTLLFLFYGLGSGLTRLAWSLFHWRASATMIALSLVTGFVLVSPWLARSWLAQGWPLRLASFATAALGVIALERNVTGTNPRLPFAISPWPVVPVFGLEVVGTIVAALLAGVALGLLGLARRDGTVARWLLVGLGLALPAAWLALGSRGFLPFRSGLRGLVLATAVGAAGLALASLGRRDPARLLRRARSLGAAALLVGVPLFVGQAWARLDYTRNRDVHAQRVIDALERYYADESVYPETLEALVERGDLDAVPRPELGFAWLGDRTPFTYQGFGTSYLLEFPAPRWVQCAYNPPYEEEKEEEDGVPAHDGDEAAGEDAVLAGAWSCPSSPPELW